MPTILVIEDDAISRELVSRVLQREGYTIVAAANGQTGVQLAQVHDPDLIVCDVMMPNMDGHAVLTQVRQQAAMANTPFIFLSAKASRGEVRQGMNLGADDYLTKPFKPQELLEAVQARLAKHQALTVPLMIAMREAAQQLTQFSYQDPQTDLPNRIAFHHQLTTALPKLPAQNQLAVFYLQLHWGHTDRLHTQLDAIARSLGALLDSRGYLARLDTQTLGILVHGPAATAELHAWGRQVTEQAVSQQPQLERADLGVAFYPQHGQTATALLEAAAIAAKPIRLHATAPSPPASPLPTPIDETATLCLDELM